MTLIPPRDPEDGDESPAASWEDLLNNLLRGFVHSLNNRIAALTAFTDLATMDASPLDVNAVRAEVDRIYVLTSLIGRLAARSDTPEALEVRAVVEAAVEMHEHHARSSRRSTEITQLHPVHPVRVPRFALLRLVLLSIDGCGPRASTLMIEITGSADRVMLTFHRCRNISAEMEDLAALCGASITVTDGSVTIALPSLPALRRLPNSP